MKKDLTIIIVTFNSSEVIGKCLESLNADKYDVVVVDNASSDNTCQIIATNFPKVKLIQSGKNLGYGRGNNIALRQAETEFVLILNPDALILENGIEVCLNILKSNPQIALASTGVTNNEVEFYQQSDDKGYGYVESNFIVGGVMFMRMEVFRKIGFFDEQFFMFAEDGEISDRSIANGYKNVLIENVKAFHEGGKSAKKTLAVIHRRFWHLGWSKSKYKLARKGKFHTIRSSLRLSIVYFFEALFYLCAFNIDKAVGKIAFASGCFSYVIGLKAFDKNGNPRG